MSYFDFMHDFVVSDLLCPLCTLENVLKICFHLSRYIQTWSLIYILLVVVDVRLVACRVKGNTTAILSSGGVSCA